MRKALLAISLLVVAPLAAAPVPKNIKGPGVIYVWSYTQPPVLNLYTPDGEHIKELKFGTKKECQITSISPGGKYAALTSFERDAAIGKCDRYTHLVPLTDVASELPKPIAGEDFRNLCWVGDRTAIITLDAGRGWSGSTRINLTTVFEHDATTGQKRPLDLEAGHEVLDVSPDRESFLTNVQVRQRGAAKFDFAHIVRPRSSETQPLCEAERVYVRGFHPDGKRVFAWRTEEEKGVGMGLNHPPPSEDLILDQETGATAPLEWAAALWASTGSRETKGWSISPDGKRVVLKWNERMWVSKNGRDKDWHWVDRLGVCDLNGQHFKVILTATPETSTNRRDAALASFAWR